MYQAYWQLQRAPFEHVSDPAFYFAGEGHQGALFKLRYAIEHGKEAALLVGDHGAGKTLLIEMLREQLPENFGPFVHLVFPQMPPCDLLAYLADEFCGTTVDQPRTIEQSVRRLRQALAKNQAAGRRAVLAIDEAHLLEHHDCWEALRLLTNFQTDGRPDLTFLLLGQMPLLTQLDRMPSWEERLAVKCVLKPLHLEETASYVAHRLTVAGGRPEVFLPEAVEAIHRLSGGLPRRINRLADLALVIGYAEELTQIGPDEVDAVCEELIAVAAA